jgi:NDP-sugar pyrophosphorylase family protein
MTLIPQADILLLAAGFGERLRPLTASIPKPLVKVGGRALIDYNLELIARAGFKRVIINLHYLPDKIKEYVGNGSKWGLEDVVYSFEPEILDTGGAIKKIKPLLLSDTLLTVNSDILIGGDFNLTKLLSAHNNDTLRPIVTAVFKESGRGEDSSYTSICLNQDDLVVSFGNQYFSENKLSNNLSKKEVFYLGIQAINIKIFKYISEDRDKFSITRDTWVGALQDGAPIRGYIYNGYFSDIGTPERLEKASKDIDAGML